ncbi:hypothetical protein BK742_13655 [Bacillus thuringiensis serovar pingluonsis]|uniref:Uncharacterized protein n=1 Tax=Bacillus thuringiensis serovar pingluonsis TaxID=180881 RepID=A0A243BEC3_BACTU|nr:MULTISPECIES: hypothetical protein [Bacillus cereus group]MEB9685585.1 hypothetical protein [Bacillus anthracis]OTY44377.1 hypothetical protein BK742_13655 [Bacillus thuringiensis serovar pingluonsis]
MFKKLGIGTFAIGIMFSGVTGVSAAQINDAPLKASDNKCAQVKHKFSQLFNSPNVPENYTKNGVSGKLVCTYPSPVGWIGYYN